jgi:hypothetical protein
MDLLSGHYHKRLRITQSVNVLSLLIGDGISHLRAKHRLNYLAMFCSKLMGYT